MALADSYLTKAEAVAAIETEGFAPSKHTAGFWVKRSFRHDGTSCVAIVVINERRIAPEYGGGSSFSVRFL